MTDTFALGTIVPLTFEVTDESTGLLVDPTAATLTVTLPDASVVTPTLSHLAVGVFANDYPAPVAGRYLAHFAATGAHAGTSDYPFLVIDNSVDATPPTSCYASVPQLTAWLGHVPDNAAALLRIASLRVDEMLLGAVYKVDVDDMPTEAEVVTALAEATCAQSAYMLDVGDFTGYSSNLTALTIGAISWARRPTPAAATSKIDPRFAPDAISILTVAGLLPITPLRLRVWKA